ncbi:MAG TPA: protein-methionine-sulfoxide reductase heme-binding subunit MsrQ [Candidatus Acidoferrales bacterium]|nr:protein-methionine-sulfoxide reductase heme-binding subunit MsrQ [Candidatus Acidoferrales bacterium]
MTADRLVPYSKPFVFLLCLVPMGLLVRKGVEGLLGANPIEVITHSTGDWTLIFLCITLSITPLRRLLGLPWLVRYRRMTGLFAFFHGFLHFMTYIWLDQFFNVHSMIKDVAKRPFITAGFTAFVLMVPLAITSTAGMIRRLGGRRWRILHRLIYVSACAGVIHYYWLVKADETLPLRFAAIVGALLACRAVFYFRDRRRPAGAPAAEHAERVT